MARTHPLDPAFAEELRQRRIAAGLSQNQVALLAGVTEISIHRWESLRYPVPPGKRAILERVLSDAERPVPA